MTLVGAVVEELATVEDDKPNNRFNDAKCDVTGRLWAGTMSRSMDKDHVHGNLYNWSAGKQKRMVCCALIAPKLYIEPSLPSRLHSWYRQ